MNPPCAHPFSFDNILVDPQCNAIYVNGVERRLEPKVIDLLCLFAANVNEVVSRQEIAASVWRGLVVGEDAITRAISALRSALGDDTKTQKYLETIPKKGYRFKADVRVAEDTSASMPIRSNRKSVNKSLAVFVALCGCVLLVIGFSVMGLWRFKVDDKFPTKIESIMPITNMEGVSLEMNLSNDGKKLLFVHDSGHANDIYSRDLQDEKNILWAHDEFLKTSPIWIDENSIAYIRWYKQQYQIVRHYRGQSPQILYLSAQRVYPLSMATKDHDNIFFLEMQTSGLIDLKSLNLRNGKQQNWRDSIPDLPKKISMLLAPARTQELLMVANENEMLVLIVLDLNTKKNAVINNQFSKIDKVIAANNNAYLLIGTLGGSQGVWLVDEKNPPQLIHRSTGSEEIVDIQMNAQRKTLFYSNSQMRRDIQIVAARDSKILELPVLNKGGVNTQGQFGNHKKIYFTSNRTGYFEVWCYDEEAKTFKPITTLNSDYILWFSLSHNGQSLAIGYKAGEIYLGVVDLNSGHLEKNLRVPTLRYPLAWSADDKLIYVSEYGDQPMLFSYDASLSKSSLFAKSAGLYVKDIDGERVMYIDFSRHALIERNLVTQQEKIVHDAIANLYSIPHGLIKLNKSNSQLYALCDTEEPNKICAYSLSTKKSQPAIIGQLPLNYWPSDISDDGESILTSDYKPATGDLMKMQLHR